MLAFFNFMLILNVFCISMGLIGVAWWWHADTDSSGSQHKPNTELRFMFEKMQSLKKIEFQVFNKTNSSNSNGLYDFIFGGFVFKVIHYFFGLFSHTRVEDADYFFLEQVAIRKKDKNVFQEGVGGNKDIFKITFNKGIENEYNARIVFKDLDENGKRIMKKHEFRRIRGKAIKKMLELARRGQIKINSLEVKHQKPASSSLLAYLNLNQNLEHYKFYRLKDLYSVYKLKVLRYEKSLRYLTRLQRLFYPENNLLSLFTDKVIYNKNKEGFYNNNIRYPFWLIDRFQQANYGFFGSRKFSLFRQKLEHNRFILWSTIRQNILLSSRFKQLFSLLSKEAKYNIWLTNMNKSFFVRKWLEDLNINIGFSRTFNKVRKTTREKFSYMFPTKYRESTFSMWYPAFDAMKIKMSNLYLASFGKNRFGFSLSDLKNVKYSDSSYYRRIERLYLQIRNFDITLNQFFFPRKGFRYYPTQSDYVLFPLNRVFTYASRNYRGQPTDIAGVRVDVWEPDKRLFAIYNIIKPLEESTYEVVVDRHLASLLSVPSHKKKGLQIIDDILISKYLKEYVLDDEDEDSDFSTYRALSNRNSFFGPMASDEDDFRAQKADPKVIDKLLARGRSIPPMFLHLVGRPGHPVEDYVINPIDPLRVVDLWGRMWGDLPLSSYLSTIVLGNLGKLHRIKDNFRVSLTGGIYDTFALIHNENVLEELNKRKHSRRVMKVLKRRQKVIRKVAWIIYLHNIELKTKDRDSIKINRKILDDYMNPVPRYKRYIQYFNSFYPSSLYQSYINYKNNSFVKKQDKVSDFFGFFYKNFIDLGLKNFEGRLLYLVKDKNTVLKARKFYIMTERINRFWNENFFSRYFNFNEKPVSSNDSLSDTWLLYNTAYENRALLPLSYDLMKTLQFTYNYMPGLGIVVRSEDLITKQARELEDLFDNVIPDTETKMAFFLTSWTNFVKGNKISRKNISEFLVLSNFFFKARVYPSLLANSYFKHYEDYALRLGKYPWNFYIRSFVYLDKVQKDFFMQKKLHKLSKLGTFLQDTTFSNKNFFSVCIGPEDSRFKGAFRTRSGFRFSRLYFQSLTRTDIVSKILYPLYGRDFSISTFEQQQQFDSSSKRGAGNIANAKFSNKYMFQLNLKMYENYKIKKSLKPDLHMNSFFLNPQAANSIGYFHKVFWFTSKAFRVRAQVGGYYRREFSRFIRLKNMEFLGTRNYMKYNLYIDKNVKDYTLQQFGFWELFTGSFWNLYEEFMKAHAFLLAILF